MRLLPSERTFVAEFLRARTGQQLAESAEVPTAHKLTRVANELGLASVEELVSWLRTGEHRELEQHVLDALVNGETKFFRDHKPFHVLRERVIPELMSTRRRDRALRCWSAACATGQEVYSLAMLIRAEFPELATWRLDLIASDLPLQRLERARRGAYRQLEVMRGLPARLLADHFHQEDQWWVIDRAIREMVDFRALNLREPWPWLPPMDLILLRNVLIYFDAQGKRDMFDKLSRALRPDGYLVLGGAETVFEHGPQFMSAGPDYPGFYRLRR